MKKIPGEVNFQYGVRRERSKPTQFLLNTTDGRIYHGTLDNLERLISHDDELLREFKKYKGDKVVKFHVFLRKYNEKYLINIY